MSHVHDDRDPETSGGDTGGATVRSFRPGGWPAVLGDELTLVLPPSEGARAAALWTLVDDGAGFDEVLDALLSEGLRGLSAFALVSSAGDEARALVRGGLRVVLAGRDQTVEVDGSAARTWVERSLPGVTRIAVETSVDALGLVAEPDPAGTDLLVSGGLVRVSRLDQPPRTVSETPEPEPTVEPEPAEEPVDEPAEEPEDEPVEGPGQDSFVGAPTEAVSLDDLMNGPSAIPPPPPYAPPAPPAAPETPSEPDDDTHDHDGLTRSGAWDPADLGRQQPGIPGQPPAPSVTARPVARLAFSSGDDVTVDRVVLVGRAPEARRFSSTEQPRLVTVPSPQQEISSTHLEIRPGSGADHGSAVVTDLGSTNGTVLAQPGLPPEDLQPGIAVQLIPGAVIDLGDGVTISVTNP